MHLTPQLPTPHSRAQAGTTLVEILIASSVAVMVLTAFMLLVMETSTEQRWGLAETQIHAEAGLLQDRVTRLIREMSASEGTVFGDPVSSGSPFYRRIIMAQGKAPAAPRQELVFSPANLSLVHDPNRKNAGDEIVLHQGSSPVKLRNMYFYASMKPGGLPDATSINVWLEVDDDGAAGRKNPDGSKRNVSVVRSFTVAMRNL